MAAGAAASRYAPSHLSLSRCRSTLPSADVLPHPTGCQEGCGDNCPQAAWGTVRSGHLAHRCLSWEAHRPSRNGMQLVCPDMPVTAVGAYRGPHSGAYSTFPSSKNTRRSMTTRSTAHHTPSPRQNESMNSGKNDLIV